VFTSVAREGETITRQSCYDLTRRTGRARAVVEIRHLLKASFERDGCNHVHLRLCRELRRKISDSGVLKYVFKKTLRTRQMSSLAKTKAQLAQEIWSQNCTSSSPSSSSIHCRTHSRHIAGSWVQRLVMLRPSGSNSSLQHSHLRAGCFAFIVVSDSMCAESEKKLGVERSVFFVRCDGQKENDSYAQYNKLRIGRPLVLRRAEFIATTCLRFRARFLPFFLLLACLFAYSQYV